MLNSKPVNSLVNPISIARCHIDIITPLRSHLHNHNIAPPLSGDCGVQGKVAMVLTEKHKIVFLAILSNRDFRIMDVWLDISMLKQPFHPRVAMDSALEFGRHLSGNSLPHWTCLSGRVHSRANIHGRLWLIY